MRPSQLHLSRVIVKLLNESNLERLNSTLGELSEQPRLKKILWRDDVATRISKAYRDLEEAVKLFNVSFLHSFSILFDFLYNPFSLERSWISVAFRLSTRLLDERTKNGSK